MTLYFEEGRSFPYLILCFEVYLVTWFLQILIWNEAKEWQLKNIDWAPSVYIVGKFLVI